MTSDTGFYATVPFDAQQGDEPGVLHGAKIPFVLRHVETGDVAGGQSNYRIVGGAYVHGFMDGEARVRAANSRLEMRSVLLM